MATVKTQASRSHSVPRLDAMASVGSMPVRASSSNELSQLSSQRRGDILEENLLQAAILASEVEFATSKKEECKPAYEALEVDATPSFSEIFG